MRLVTNVIYASVLFSEVGAHRETSDAIVAERSRLTCVRMMARAALIPYSMNSN